MAKETVISPKNVMRPMRRNGEIPAVYIRVRQVNGKKIYSPPDSIFSFRYTDEVAGSRIIKALRVEEAVEKQDFIAIANKHDLDVVFHADGSVSLFSAHVNMVLATKPTIREAVIRFCLDNNIEL